MSLRAVVLALLLAAVGFAAWRSQLFTVQRPGESPRALVIGEPAGRRPTRFDVVLPAVPAGQRHLIEGRAVTLIHYWAPWEQNSRAQATTLDSLRRVPGLEGLDVYVVCFDPFPSVARYVARHRLRLSVLLDPHGVLRDALPCPSIPYTYVVDRSGRIAAAQDGEVEWLAPETAEGLRKLLEEPPGEGAGDGPVAGGLASPQERP